MISSYDVINKSAREDLTDDLVLRGDNSAKFFKALKMKSNKPIQGIYHEWQGYTLAAATDNAQTQGFTPATASTDTTRYSNYIQIFQKSFQVAKTTTQNTKLAGIADYVRWQSDNQFKELAKDIEYALHNNAASVSGDASTASKFCGIWAPITGLGTSNTMTPAATTSTFVESELLELIRRVYDQTGNEDVEFKLHTGSININRITGFTGINKTQMVGAKEDALNRLLRVIYTDFGNVLLVPNAIVGNAKMGIFNMDTWALAVKRQPEFNPSPVDADAVKYYWVTELTIEHLNPTANGVMSGIATTTA